MSATSKDVADHAGVSRSTVSQILNGRGASFAAETRARVERAVAELGYQPSAAGRALVNGSSDIVIALIPNTTFGPNLQDINDLLTQELAQRGLTLLLRLATHSPEALERLMVSIKPRAVLSMTRLSSSERTMIERSGVAVIEPAAGSAGDDNAQIGALQARYLIDHGHRRLAYAHLRDSRADPFGVPRRRAFADVCRAQGLDAPRVVALGLDPDEAGAALDDLGSPGFAVACYNDDVAMALLFAAAQRDWRVPGDLALIGMDHTPLSRVTSPQLTTMEFDLAWVAAKTVGFILMRLDPRDEPVDSGDARIRIIDGTTV